MNFLVKLVLSALAVIIGAYLLPGVEVSGFLAALIVAAVVALLNAVIRPVLIILTIPITVITLGLFLLVINATIILLANALVPGFYVQGFWWALIFGLILSILNSLFGGLNSKDR